MSVTSDYLYGKYQRLVLSSNEVCTELGVTEEGLASLIKEKALSPLPGPDTRFPVPGVARYLDGPNEATTPHTPLTTPQAVGLPPVLTVAELAQVLKIGRNAAYKLLNDPVLGAIRVRNSWRIPGDNVKKYLAKHTEESYPTDGNAVSGPSNEN